MDPAEESRCLDRLVGRLGERFPDIPPQVITEAVAESHRGFGGAPIRDFVPVLVEHEVVAGLRSRAHRAVG